MSWNKEWKILWQKHNSKTVLTKLYKRASSSSHFAATPLLAVVIRYIRPWCCLSGLQFTPEGNEIVMKCGTILPASAINNYQQSASSFNIFLLFLNCVNRQRGCPCVKWYPLKANWWFGKLLCSCNSFVALWWTSQTKSQPLKINMGVQRTAAVFTFPLLSYRAVLFTYIHAVLGDNSVCVSPLLSRS